MSDLVAALRSGSVLLMDGAMGTELSRPPPRGAAGIHSAYTAAGADIILTNTFQAIDHAAWQSAIRSARRARPRPRFILGDIGPVKKPTKALADGLFAECAGLDGVLLETWTSLDALEIFATARPRKLPLLVSFTYLQGPHGEIVTFDGDRPATCAAAAKKCGAVAVGANCGKEINLVDMVRIALQYRLACNLPIFLKPNAGTPKRARGGCKYPATPDTMARRLPALLTAGAAMIGGCCGTTPAHIAAFRKVVDAWNQR